MQSIDPQNRYAKVAVMELFEDRYGRAKRKPYYVAQIKTLLETNFSDDVVYQAIMQLVGEHRLSKTTADTKYAQKIVFLYNTKFDNPTFKHSCDMHVKSTCKLIDKYSNPDVSKQYGEYLESLVKAELQKQGFTIVGVHTNKYKNKKYSKSNNNLDFIAEHRSGRLTIGVEVKNTISMVDKKEVDIKVQMCDFLGITPVFATRWLEPYTKLIDDKGGFSWTFKTQLYPPYVNALTKTLSKRLHLPVNVETKLPPESVQLFHNWVKKQTT